VIDEHDAVAEGFHLVHLVRGHDDGPACGALLLDDVLDQARVDRVEPGEGLVHDDEVGLVHESRDNLRLLLHALAEVLHLLVAVVVQVEPLQPVGQPAPRLPLVQALEGRKIDQRRLQLEVHVQAALLRQVADAVLLRLIEPAAKDLDITGIGPEDIEHHADGRRLACAVRPEQAEDFARVDLEGDAVDRPDGAEALAEA